MSSYPKIIEWILRLAVFGQCAGMAVQATSGSPFGSMMFMDWGWSHETSVRIEYVFAGLLIALGLATLVRVNRYILAFIVFYTILIACAAYDQGGEHFSQWTIPAHAMRIAAPLALLILPVTQAGSVEGNRWTPVLWVILLGTASTFFTHGIQAFLLHPRFVDYIIGAASNLLDVQIGQALAESLLRVIGVVDMTAALLLLILRSPIVAGWMAFWGFISAAVRLAELGFGVYGELLIRFSHFCLPAVFILLILYLENSRLRVVNRGVFWTRERVAD